jgi:dUTP pyrophosphatase
LKIVVIAKIKKLNKDAKLPNYARAGDAGLDIYSIKDVILKPGERKAVRTGISCEIPCGYAFFVWDKSGLALREGIKTMAGVIDAGYCGEYQIVILNLSLKPYKIKKGEKIAQMILQKLETVEVEEVDELSESERGKGGFGSSGR